MVDFFKVFGNLLGFEAKATTSPRPSSEAVFSFYRGLDGSVFAFRTVSTNELLASWEEIAPLNTGLMKISNAVGGLPIALWDEKAKKKVNDHPILQLLRSPNREMQRTKRDFMRDMVFWKMLSGNAYIQLVGSKNLLEMYVLLSTHMTPEQDRNGFVGTYAYQANMNLLRFNRNQKDRFVTDDGLSELVDIMNISPRFSTGNLFGTSAITALQHELNQYLLGAQHNLALLANGATPSGAFVLKHRDNSSPVLTDEEYERIKGELQTAYIGSRNAGRPLVLEGGMEWQPFSLSPKDMDFKALKEDAEKQIYKNLGVPIELVMGIGTTFSNMSNVRIEFYENTVVPIAEDLLDNLTLDVLHVRYPESKNLRLIVDRDEIPVLAPVRMEQRKVIETSMTMTINEKRAYFGQSPIEKGDKIVDSNGRPIAGKDAEGVVNELPKAKTVE